MLVDDEGAARAHPADVVAAPGRARVRVGLGEGAVVGAAPVVAEDLRQPGGRGLEASGHRCDRLVAAGLRDGPARAPLGPRVELGAAPREGAARLFVTLARFSVA